MQRILVIGGTGRLPTGMAEKLAGFDIQVVDEGDSERYMPGQSSEQFDLVIRKVPRCAPYKVPGVRKGKGEKRRNKKLRGW